MIKESIGEWDLEDGHYLVYLNVFQGHVTNVQSTHVFQLESNGEDGTNLVQFLEASLGTHEFTITGIVKGKLNDTVHKDN